MFKKYCDQLQSSPVDCKGSIPIVPMIKKIKNDKRRVKARQQFFEGISISGLLEFYYAPSIPIRWMWILALITSTGSIFYHTVLLINLNLNQDPTYKIIQTNTEIIPFPKIIVCSPTGTKRTWAYENIKLPLREQKLFANLSDHGKKRFLEAIASLLGNGFDYIVDHGLKSSSPKYFAYHHAITETYKQMNYTKEVKEGFALASCEETVSNCRLDGVDFDCCDNAIVIVGDDGPCYDLQVDKIDSLLAHRPQLHMTPISFTFTLKINWNYVLNYSTINGFSIHISDPYSPFSRPIAVPAATHTLIDISQPTLRKDKSACFDGKMPDTLFGPYDANGYNCKLHRHFEELVMKFLGCTFMYSSYVPRPSQMCTGSQVTPLKMILANGETEDLEIVHQKAFNEIHRSKTRCLPLCTAWKYTARPSFSDLMRQDYTTPIGRGNTDNVTISRVTIFIGSSYYIEKTEDDRKMPYQTFGQIGEVFGLYLGCSVVTIAEIVFYGCQLCLVYKKTYVKKNKVGPKV